MIQKHLSVIYCYDISEAKRLRKVHKIIRKECFMLQRSVYLFKGLPLAHKRLNQQLINTMHPRDDSLWICPLSSAPQIKQLAKSCLPEGIMSPYLVPFLITQQ